MSVNDLFESDGYCLREPFSTVVPMLAIDGHEERHLASEVTFSPIVSFASLQEVLNRFEHVCVHYLLYADFFSLASLNSTFLRLDKDKFKCCSNRKAKSAE